MSVDSEFYDNDGLRCHKPGGLVAWTLYCLCPGKRMSVIVITLGANGHLRLKSPDLYRHGILIQHFVTIFKRRKLLCYVTETV